MKQRSRVIFVYRLPLLTDPQLAVVSEILKDTGLIVFGGEIIPFVFGQIDKPNWIVVVLTLILTGLLYLASISIVRHIDHL